MMKVAGVVVALTLFAVLSAVGYFAQVGFSQSFGPSDPARGGNVAEHRPRGNRVLNNRASSDDPPRPRVEGWVDVPEEELTNKVRVANRPGNYLAISAVIDFADGLCQIEPEYRNLGFPLLLDSEWIAKKEDFRGWIQPDKSGINKNRRKNLEVQDVQVFNLEGDADITDVPDSMGVPKSKLDTIEKLRKKHPGRLVFVSITLTAERLDSEKSNSEEKTRFILHHDEGGWKIICIDG
jgi:hypothetical protein